MTTAAAPDLAVLDYRPPMPRQPLGIGVVGCGSIVQEAHLPAYAKHGLPVVGVFDVVPEASVAAAQRYGVDVLDSLEAVLEHPDVTVVDVGVRTEDRPPLVRAALEAGRHVLSQKPFAPTVAEGEALVALAADRGLKLAVNQNARWAPPFRLATLLQQSGALGEVTAVTHVFETSLAWSIERHFNEMAHFLLYDYAVHWFDISRCWLAGKELTEIRAREWRAPNQPPEAHTEWAIGVEISCADGTTAVIRGVGHAADEQPRRHPFWLHGTEGTVRGSVLGGDHAELQRGAVTLRPELEGNWYPDGFAGTMGELQCAIEEDREPFNAAAHNLLSLELTLAAVESAEQAGAPVALRRAA